MAQLGMDVCRLLALLTANSEPANSFLTTRSERYRQEGFVT
jgi:hypothetical protein